MSTESTTSPTPAVPAINAPPAVVELLETEIVMRAIVDPVRRTLLYALADGAPRSVNDLARELDRPADGISKHLRILRTARLVRAVGPAGGDGRKQFHELPKLFLSHDTNGSRVLDFGAVVLRLQGRSDGREAARSDGCRGATRSDGFSVGR